MRPAGDGQRFILWTLLVAATGFACVGGEDSFDDFVVRQPLPGDDRSTDGRTSTLLASFEDGSTEGWAGYGIAGGPWSVTDWHANGRSSLKANIELSPNESYRLSVQDPAALEGATTLRATVRRSYGGSWGGDLWAKIFMKTGPDWQWFESGALPVEPSGTELSLNLTSIPDLGFIRELGVVFLASPSASGSGAIFVDQVRVETHDSRTVEAVVEVERPYLTIPPSFLGVSQEWLWLGSMTGNEQVIRLLRELSSFNTGPLILRVGGGSTDTQRSVPSRGVWEGLARLHRDLGMKFMLGLNLAANDIELAKRQFLAARAGLPDDAVVAFEIGNEPDYYFKEGYRSDKNWLRDYPAIFRDWGNNLACSSQPCDYRQFAGPVWGHIYLEPAKLDWILRSTHHLLQLVTVHFYKDTKETYTDVVTMLDEPRLQHAMDSLRSQVEVAERHGVRLRVGESNSISNGGRLGVSDAFSSALWALDTTFEIAHNGAVGVNYHQASHYGFFEVVPDPATGRPSAVVRPCYLAYLLFQQAVRNGGALLSKEISGAAQIKVWPVVSGNEIRVVVISKDARPIDVRIALDSRAYGDGVLTRLEAPSLSATSGVTLGGRSYDGIGGYPSGTARSESVVPQLSGDGKTYVVSMPPYSAAMLVVSR